MPIEGVLHHAEMTRPLYPLLVQSLCGWCPKNEVPSVTNIFIIIWTGATPSKRWFWLWSWGKLTWGSVRQSYFSQLGRVSFHEGGLSNPLLCLPQLRSETHWWGGSAIFNTRSPSFPQALTSSLWRWERRGRYLWLMQKWSTSILSMSICSHGHNSLQGRMKNRV